MVNDGLNISRGQNEGEAQVFRPFDYSYLDRQEANRQREAQAREAASQKRVSDLSKQLQSLNKLDIFHRDQPVFQKKNQELWDFASKNIGNIRRGDINSKLKIDQMIADLENEAELSKADKEAYVKMNEDLAKSGKMNSLRPESQDYLVQFADPANAGKYGFDASQVKFDTNIGEWVNKQLSPIAKAQAEKGKTITKPDVNGVVYSTKYHNYTPQEAETLFERNAGLDPIILEQINTDFNRLPDEQKSMYANPMDYAKKQYAKNLVINDNEAGVQSIGKPDSGFGVSGNTYTTKDWRFTGSPAEVPNPNYSVTRAMLNPFYDESKTVPVKRVHVNKTNQAENPVYMVTDPKNTKKKFPGVLDYIDNHEDGTKVYTFTDKNTNKKIQVPEDLAGPEVKGELGENINKIFDSGIAEGQGGVIETDSRRKTVVPKPENKSNVPSASKQEWINAGWSDEKIKKAVEKGLIKVL